ncbi:hypothetical protein FACS1894204_09270 [Synergistales bacterium]|nr:hypothetical protein FACS1894204_09270 [Synergistales bacterium]
MRNGRSLERKIILILLLFAVVISVTIGAVGYKTYMDSTFARYRSAAMSALKLSRRFLDVDDMGACLRTGTKSAVYEWTQDSFNRIKENLGVAYIYLFDITDDGRILYYVNAFTDPERERMIKAGEKINSLGDTERFPDDVTLQLLNIDSLKTPLAEIINKTQYGYMLSVYSPVTDSKGESIGLLGVDVDMKEINADLLSYVSTVAAGAMATGLLFTALLILFIRRNITAPIKIIAAKASEFAAANHEEGELSAIKLGINKSDEIGVMALAFEKMTEDLVRYVSELTSAVANRERMKSELDVARKIQVSILPSEFPSVDAFDLYASMTPAREIGGDFYDFFMVDDSHIAVVIADVSGKGIPAALFMMMSRTLIKKEAALGGEPNAALESANKTLCDGNKTCMFVTAFLGVYDITTGVLRYANAGHNPPLVVKYGKEPVFVKSRLSVPLAVTCMASYKSEEVIIEPGDCLFLYTDGVTEASNDKKEFFSEGRLADTLRLEVRDRTCARSVIERVTGELEKFVGGAEQWDDITMLALARHA